jgi:hypothetical protein
MVEPVSKEKKSTHALFQARIWREYAQAWDGKVTSSGVGREWVEKVLRIPRAECIRRAREALS